MKVEPAREELARNRSSTLGLFGGWRGSSDSPGPTFEFGLESKWKEAIGRPLAAAFSLFVCLFWKATCRSLSLSLSFSLVASLVASLHCSSSSSAGLPVGSSFTPAQRRGDEQPNGARKPTPRRAGRIEVARVRMVLLCWAALM